jgi:hypothetical protein
VSRIRQLRLVVHASDYEQAVRCFRDVLGAPVEEEYAGAGGAQVTILDVDREKAAAYQWQSGHIHGSAVAPALSAPAYGCLSPRLVRCNEPSRLGARMNNARQSPDPR